MNFVNCEACNDCILYIANGEEPLDDDTFLGRFDSSVEWICGWDEEDEEERVDDYNLHLGFSWHSCDCCGSKLGGDRYKVCFRDK